MHIETLINAIGELTEDETKELAIAALSQLREELQFDAIQEALTEDSLAELAASVEADNE